MRQQLKFNDTPQLPWRNVERRSPIGGGKFYCCVDALPVPSVANQRPPITTYKSLITAFLIDTPAIRIAPKSFHCFADLHSNRHSSGPVLFPASFKFSATD